MTFRTLVLMTITAVCVWTAISVGIAFASTHAPCTAHYASTPYIDYVSNEVVYLQGGGGIGGCPLVLTTTGESVTITVCLQHLDGTWQDVTCVGPKTKGWNRYWRYARSNTATVPPTACMAGAWRTDVRGGDGFAPYEWWSPTRSFVASDGNECGEPGGA